MNKNKLKKIYFVTLGEEEPYILLFESKELRDFILNNENNYFNLDSISIIYNGEILLSNVLNKYTLIKYITNNYEPKVLVDYLKEFFENEEVSLAKIETINLEDKDIDIVMADNYLLNNISNDRSLDPLFLQMLIDEHNKDIKIRKSEVEFESQPYAKDILF